MHQCRMRPQANIGVQADHRRLKNPIPEPVGAEQACRGAAIAGRQIARQIERERQRGERPTAGLGRRRPGCEAEAAEAELRWHKLCRVTRCNDVSAQRWLGGSGQRMKDAPPIWGTGRAWASDFGGRSGTGDRMTDRWCAEL